MSKILLIEDEYNLKESITTFLTDEGFDTLEAKDGTDGVELANIGAYQQFERQSFEQQGIGLGLIVSKKLVEFYGGELKLESTYKEQTTVTIILPVS